MTELLKLAERIEAGQNCFSEVLTIIAQGRYVSIATLSGALQGSLDAAKKLHDELLPGWALANMWEKEDDQGWFVRISRRDNDNDYHEGDWAKTPAAAWVAAILRAVYSMENPDA